MMFGPQFTPPPGPPAARFGELFKAARILLKEREADEDLIVPTLLAAHEIDRGVQRWLEKREEVLRDNLTYLRRTKIGDGHRQTEGPRNLRVVKVVDDILILAYEPVSAELVSSFSSASTYDGYESLTLKWKSPFWSETVRRNQHPYSAVLIRVYPHKKRVKPEEVAVHYENVLAAEGISYASSRNAFVEYDFTGELLYLLVTAGRWRMGKQKPSFPPPRLVGNFYYGLSQEFGERLMTRKAGFLMDADTLVPACIAFFLRASGGFKGRAEIERLLNEHLFDGADKYLPGTSVGQNVQLWRDVKKAQRQVMRALARL
jgi:hypothetical protein